MTQVESSRMDVPSSASALTFLFLDVGALGETIVLGCEVGCAGDTECCDWMWPE